jgi:hypothetical protein
VTDEAEQTERRLAERARIVAFLNRMYDHVKTIGKTAREALLDAMVPIATRRYWDCASLDDAERASLAELAEQMAHPAAIAEQGDVSKLLTRMADEPDQHDPREALLEAIAIIEAGNHVDSPLPEAGITADGEWFVTPAALKASAKRFSLSEHVIVMLDDLRVIAKRLHDEWDVGFGRAEWAEDCRDDGTFWWRLELATGGWSANEALLHGLHDTFRYTCLKATLAGGLYVFSFGDVPDEARKAFLL